MVVFATASVILKITIMSKKEKITALNVLTAWIFALSICIFAYPIILDKFSPPYVAAVTGVVVLSGENIVSYVMYRFKVGVILAWVVNAVFEKAKTLLK